MFLNSFEIEDINQSRQKDSEQFNELKQIVKNHPYITLVIISFILYATETITKMRHRRDSNSGSPVY